jgi:leucyl/phenylalanyl-tRNA--protein transferase
MGIFPWFNPDEPPLWWSPDPRFVLIPEQVKISKSMRQILRAAKFEVTFDQDFMGVIRGCQAQYRPGQLGTWISEEFIQSYQELFELGFVHSVEVWREGQLVGGLYGGCMGKCFFGESMFARESNASKVGFITLARNFIAHRFELVDCQVYTPHLESLGAGMIPRLTFLKCIERNAQRHFTKVNWQDVFQTGFSDW